SSGISSAPLPKRGSVLNHFGVRAVAQVTTYLFPQELGGASVSSPNCAPNSQALNCIACVPSTALPSRNAIPCDPEPGAYHQNAIGGPLSGANRKNGLIQCGVSDLADQIGSCRTPAHMSYSVCATFRSRAG